MEQDAGRDNPQVAEFVMLVRQLDPVPLKAFLEPEPLTPDQLNGPWFDFDAPAVVFARRDLGVLDVLLAAGADIRHKSQRWAGGFGVLHGAEPELAEALLERGAELDVWSAAELGKLEQLKQMIVADPKLVRAQGPDGKTPLHCAHSVAVAEYLLQQGAELDVRCVDHESTPVQYLVGERPEVARFLVEQGCRVDIMLAAALGDQALAEQVLSEQPQWIAACIDRNWFPSQAADSIYGWSLGWYATPHQVAHKRGQTLMVDFLFQRSPPAVRLLNACLLEQPERAAWTDDEARALVRSLDASLHAHVAHAARNNDTGAVTRLLSAGFPVDATGQHAGTPLHWAAFHGNVDMLRSILAEHPSLEQLDQDFQCTPLQWALQGSHSGWYRDSGDFEGVVRELIEHGARVEAAWARTRIEAIDAQLLKAASP